MVVMMEAMQYNLHPGTTYVIEAVGLMDQAQLDTSKVATSFSITDDINCNGEKINIYIHVYSNKSALCVV